MSSLFFQKTLSKFVFISFVVINHASISSYAAESQNRCNLFREITKNSKLLSASESISELEKLAEKFDRKDLVPIAKQLKLYFDKESSKNVRQVYLEMLNELRNFKNPRIQYFVANVVEAKRLMKKNIYSAIESALQPFYSTQMAQEKVTAYQQGKLNLAKVLGNLSHDQMLQHLLGDSLENILPDSLLGRFLQEATKVLGAPPATRLTRFPSLSSTRGHNGTRLFIALDAQTFPIYKEFFTNPHFLTHTHSSRQGTLYIAHNGLVGSYAKLDSEMREPSIDSLLPSILLSSAEANNMLLFGELGRADSEVAQYPWTLGQVNLRKKQFTPYSAKSAYTCCTHWIGNIPIGEITTNKHMFPAQYNGNTATTKILSRYNVKFEGIEDHPENIDWDYVENLGPFRPHAYTRLVWTVPGRQQLWQVLGLRDQQIQGELANPGYVANSLITKTSPDRVPFVFFMTEDARQALPDNETIQSTISPH